MRYFAFVILLLTICTAVFFSCAKWHDPAPVNDPRLTNPYCNDPLAVNYNWGFPGKPDNSICFYPNSLFVGTYMYYDSMYIDTLFIGADSTAILIQSLGSDTTHTKLTLTGLCSILNATALPGYQATIDTNVTDTVTGVGGQIFCTHDTLNGVISRDRLDSPTVLHMNFIVVTDTATITHIGTARIH